MGWGEAHQGPRSFVGVYDSRSDRYPLIQVVDGVSIEVAWFRDGEAARRIAEVADRCGIDLVRPQW